MQPELTQASLPPITGYHAQFFSMLALAAVGTKLPFLKRPLAWFEVFFHEVSHGLAALLTFGRPLRLTLTWRGAGSLQSRGGWAVPILFAGYFGASLWGVLVYLAGVFSSEATGQTILVGLLIFLGVVVFLWVRTLTTLLIILVIAGVLFLPIYFDQSQYAPQLLQFIGLSVGLNGLKSPLHLLGGKSVGDGAELAKRTLIPEGIWVLLWFLLGILGVLYMWQIPLPASERNLGFLPGL